MLSEMLYQGGHAGVVDMKVGPSNQHPFRFLSAPVDQEG